MDWKQVALAAAIGAVGSLLGVFLRMLFDVQRKPRPKRPSAGLTALFIAGLATMGLAVWAAQRTIGAHWSDNQNCVLGITVAALVVWLFAFLRRVLFGPHING
jgi:uncharacterized membrane protein